MWYIKLSHIQCRLCTECQTLHRLPRTRALMFSFKTLLYPPSEIKAEGLALAVVETNDGITRGNVPRCSWYKRVVVWSDAVKKYLLSDRSRSTSLDVGLSSLLVSGLRASSKSGAPTRRRCDSIDLGQ